MAHRKMKRYAMDLNGKSMNSALSLMGLAFFLRLVYYFACVQIETVSFWELLTWMILPMLLEGAFIVMIRVLRLNLPGIYAIMAAAVGVVMVLQSFSYGSVLRTVLAIMAYVGCGVLIIGVAGGYLSKQIAFAGYLVAALIRFLGFEMVQMVFSLRLTAFIKDATGLFTLLGLMYLAAAFKNMDKSQ